MSKPMIWVSLAVMVLVFRGFGADEARGAASPFFWGVALDGYPITSEKLSQIERETALPPQIVVFYLQWPVSPVEKHFPQETLDLIWSHEAIACVSWEPMTYHGTTETMIPYREILEGRYDEYIKYFAEASRRWQKPFIIRFAHEMNTERYHWGTTREAFGPDSPEIYRQMFSYIVNLFRRHGADNVLWAFCPNAESVPSSSYQPGAEWNAARNYYPGDDVVDILGMDGYNWGATQTKQKNGWDSRWQSFEEIFSPLYEELRAVAPDKPFIVFETASVNESGRLAAWLRDAFAVLYRWGVRGMVWFQANKEVDWRINAAAERRSVELIRSRSSCCPQTWIGQFGAERRRRLRP